jgi:Tol biopolymer transport system component
MKDDYGVPQLWTVSPTGGDPVAVTRTAAGVASAFTWSPLGCHVAFVTDNRVAAVEVDTGELVFLTDHCSGNESVRPEACVFSPDGRRVAFVVRSAGGTNQIHVAEMPAQARFRRSRPKEL